MRSTLVVIGVAFLFAGPFNAQDRRGAMPPFNLMEELALPSEQQRPSVREAGAKLRQSQVPRWGDAMGLVVTTHPFGMDVTPAVTGLFYLGRDVPQFGSKGDLVWEVRIFRLEAISELYWVSAATKSVRSLLPR